MWNYFHVSLKYNCSFIPTKPVLWSYEPIMEAVYQTTFCLYLKVFEGVPIFTCNKPRQTQHNIKQQRQLNLAFGMHFFHRQMQRCNLYSPWLACIVINVNWPKVDTKWHNSFIKFFFSLFSPSSTSTKPFFFPLIILISSKFF